MNKIKPYSFTRSSTKQQLPTIKLKTSRIGALTQNKSYLGQISKQISGNIEYDQMDHNKLNKQQRKLKDILRRMNDDTVKIIQDYTPRARKVANHHRTATSVLAVKQKQMENNHKIMEQCEGEIEKLKIRAQGLSTYSTKQVYDEHIGNMQQQVLKLQEQNRLLKVQNQRRGKSIVTQNRIIQQGEMRKMETDVYLAEHKAGHLRADDERVIFQIKQYEHKIKQINSKWVQADKYLKQFEKKTKILTQNQKNQQQYFHKKATLQNIRKKNQFYNQNYQYRYLNLLRQLDICTISGKQTQQKVDKSFVAIQATKMVINKLQTQFKVLKNKRKQRQSQINQFLNKTRQKNVQKQQSLSKILNNQEIKQGFSQIQARTENQAELSKIQLDQVIQNIVQGKGIVTPKKDASRVKQHKTEQLLLDNKEKIQRDQVNIEYYQ